MSIPTSIGTYLKHTDTCNRLAKSRKFQHSGDDEHGENLYVSTEDASYEQAVQAWLAEEPDFDGEKFGDGNAVKYGHYSKYSPHVPGSFSDWMLTAAVSAQCVWSNTSHVGMAKAMSKNGGTFIVARYWPQGNIVGEKPF